MCHKVIHLLPKDGLKWYHYNFLNKPIDPEYYVDSIFETESRGKFLKLYANHDLLKFIGLSKKFNPGHVNAFYCNLELTIVGLKSRSKINVMKFAYGYLTKYLGLTSSSASIIAAKLSEYDKVHFVLSISKFVAKNIVMLNFLISHTILEVNGIVSKEEDFVEDLTIMDEYRFSMMRYYIYIDGVYYYLEKSGRQMYDDRIMETVKDPSNEVGASSYGLLSTDVKTYLDKLVRKILEDNKVKEEIIMGKIEVVAKKGEESRNRLKEELKDDEILV
ncbi:unnamed protein product [Vicia faba]|uniref:Uncharacterized protein n=1 Tax=Vicia faba TaxID=3906 RepID=A0AAV0Z2N4_VICFA|nr:unnamed protein product [Vicia faba]